jgi:alkylation response protein AidB-like acyl-CoA dehydrogenase
MTGGEAEEESVAGDVATALIEQARAMVPRLKERAAAAEQRREMADETARELQAAGFYRILLPKAYGGLEGSFATAMEIAFELARGCASSAWVYVNNAAHNLTLAAFPAAAQEAFWGNGQGHRLAATGSSPRWTKCEAAPEGANGPGYLLSGHWEFNSGLNSADAIILSAMVGGRPDQLRFFLVMKDQYRRLDDWDTFGLKATGSTSGIIEQPLFIPEHLSQPVGPMSRRTAPGEALLAQGAGVADFAWAKVPFGTWYPLSLVPTMVGAAQGALDYMRERIPQRTNVLGARPADMQSVQLRLAEAQMKITMARYLLLEDSLRDIERFLQRNEQPDLVSRGRWRANAAQAALLAREAMLSLQYKAGAHAIFNDQFLGRQFRDVMAGTPHISMDWDVSGTIYGKALLGIDTSKEPLH